MPIRKIYFDALLWRILPVAAGLLGFHAVAADQPHVIVLDGALPILDGLTTTARLRADPATSGIKIVMVSARAQQTDIRRGLEAGVDIYVTKPFDPAVLIRAVQELAEARALDVDG